MEILRKIAVGEIGANVAPRHGLKGKKKSSKLIEQIHFEYLTSSSKLYLSRTLNSNIPLPRMAWNTKANVRFTNILKEYNLQKKNLRIRTLVTCCVGKMSL